MSPLAYPSYERSHLSLVQPHVRVVRAFALDAQRHLSLLGRYPRYLALPDRWQSWIATAVPLGIGLVRRWRPHVIMSTFPIASAHVIASVLKRIFGLPWVADIRDPIAQDNYPADARLRKALAAVERNVFRRADRVVVTTPGTVALYRERYPEYRRESIVLVPNGYDEAAFEQSAADRSRSPTPPRKPITLVHAGVLSPPERDPTALLLALAELRDEGVLKPGGVRFVFRGSGNDRAFSSEIDKWALGDFIDVLPQVPYTEALREMLEADACLLLQGATCNNQIPAKAYEYLYSGKPILALTDARGDTATLLASSGVSSIVSLADKTAIKEYLPRYIEQLRLGTAPVPREEEVKRYSRVALTRELALVLDDVLQTERSL